MINPSAQCSSSARDSFPCWAWKRCKSTRKKKCYSCHSRAFSLSLPMPEHSNLHCKIFHRFRCWHHASAAPKALQIKLLYLYKFIYTNKKISIKNGTLDHWQFHYEVFRLCLSSEILQPVQPLLMLKFCRVTWEWNTQRSHQHLWFVVVALVCLFLTFWLQ